ncbi:MAG: hypothetical protein IKU58_06145 [Clostridia bacterium]|nr:hypothetical protein [Clostridia bacterium]
MKKRTVLPLVLLVCATVILCCRAANWKSDKPFVYPDIQTFNSSNAGKRACRVPEEVAKNMTTRALVETVMNYPYLVDMYAFDSIDLWFKGVRNLPMMAELCARPDCLAVLRAEALKAENDDLGYYINLILCLERAAQK